MLSPAALVGLRIDAREVAYSAADTLLYALSLGFGADPLDAHQLGYVYEQAQQVVPTFPLVVGYPGFFMRDPRFTLGWDRLLHAEEHLVLHRQLPPAGIVRDCTHIDALVDRGADKGCFVQTRKELHSENDGLHLATLYSNLLCRDDGGGGSGGTPRPALESAPASSPDRLETVTTLPQQGLLYRLSGDTNPVHVDPDAARRAGFDRPLLHGRCTLGLAVHAVMRACLAYDGAGITEIMVRFAAPFFPGETLQVSCWQTRDKIQFAAASAERGIPVLSHGLIRLAD